MFNLPNFITITMDHLTTSNWIFSIPNALYEKNDRDKIHRKYKKKSIVGNKLREKKNQNQNQNTFFAKYFFLLVNPRDHHRIMKKGSKEH